MDPQPERSPGLALPQPPMERGGQGYGAMGGPGPERGAVSPEMGQPAQAPAFAAPPASQPMLPPPTASAPSATAVATAPALPTASDDDASKLDQEWVERAKAIIERTKSDPYQESQELGKTKADYLRIRYNKHIKVAEEQAQ